LGDILTNFRQKYAEIRAKLKTKNIEADLALFLNFAKKAEILKSKNI